MHKDCTPPWADRLLSKVDASGDCWLWTAYVDPAGYARLSYLDEKCYAHRLIHEWLVGPIPEKYDVDHLCRVRHCVNPDHLEAVPHRTNSLRGYGAFTTQARRGKIGSTDANVIRRRYATGDGSLRTLGEEYRVSWKTIHAIVQGKTYARVG